MQSARSVKPLLGEEGDTKEDENQHLIPKTYWGKLGECFVSFVCCKQLDKRDASPKSFFSNERTFLQWFNAATLLASVGLTLIGIAEVEGLGQMLVPLAIIIACYSLFVFHWRYYVLSTGGAESSSSYSNKRGATILVLVLCIIFIILLSSKASLTSESSINDSCGIFSLAFNEPFVGNATGLAFNPDNTRVYGTSQNAIFIMTLITGQVYGDFETYDYFLPIVFGDGTSPPEVYSSFMGITIDGNTGLLYVASNHQSDSYQPTGKILEIDPNTKRITSVFASAMQDDISGLAMVKTSTKTLFYAGYRSTNEVIVYSWKDQTFFYEYKFQPFVGAPRELSLGLTSISFFDNTIAYHYKLHNHSHTVVFYELDTKNATDYVGTFKRVLSADAIERDAQTICFTSEYAHDVGMGGLSTALIYSASKHKLFQYRVDTLASNSANLVNSCHNANMPHHVK